MKALGIVLAGGSSYRLKELSKKRCVAAMPMAGGYRAIDFVLSNMTNSHIQKVAVLTQYNTRSLNEHMNSSKWWNFGRKNGGLFVFTPTLTTDNSNWYRGTADALAQNLEFIKKSHEPYVVIAGGDGIYKMDYNDIIEYHIEKDADITIACTTAPEDADMSRFGVVTCDDDNRIHTYEEKPMASDSRTISMGIYVIRRRLLIELLEQAIVERRFDFVKDIVIRYKNVKKIYAYKTDIYWQNIASVDSYFNTNMDFLKPEIRSEFFRQAPYIYTKVEDLAPAKYNESAMVSNSIVSSGTIINGTVENSVIFKNVFIGNHCLIKNCVVLNDVYIGDNCHLENCIVESRDSIKANTTILGQGEISIVTGHKDIR